MSDRPGPDDVTIETPEHATFTYEVAGVMSRALAAIIDHAIQVMAILAIILTVAISMAGTRGTFEDDISAGLQAAAVLGFFVIMWGYFVFFEIAWNGQTPGKRLVGIRVIREGGYGITPGSVLVRNLLRFVGDLLPFPMVGLGFMFANPRCKRVGDWIAGTIVVRDAPPEGVPSEAPSPRADENLLNDLRRAGIHRLRQEYAQAIESFLARAHTLDTGARFDVARRLCEPLAQTLSMPAPDPERMLRHVAAALRQSVERREVSFLRAGRGSWARLDALGARLEALTSAELLELVAVYRRTTGDLARARTLKARSGIVDYLNRLVGRVHFRLYAARAWSGGALARFFTHTLPDAVRRNANPVWAATLMMIVPAVIAYFAVSANPPLLRVFVPPHYADQVDQYERLENRGIGMSSFMTSFYIANNVRVAFLTFGAGIALGLGSLAVLVLNGAIVGAMIAGTAQAGSARPLLTFISSHGGIELFAFVLAGAAGVRLGAALINPGDLSRKQALIEGGRDAGIMMFGVILMLLIAAVFEAWFSPTASIPDVVKWIVGVLNLTWVIAYFVLVGRSPKPT